MTGEATGPVLTLGHGGGYWYSTRAMIGKGQESGERYLVMVSSVQLHLLLLKARPGSGGRRWRGSEAAWLVAVITSGHHHDLLPLLLLLLGGGGRRGPDAAGWGHQLHLRHCVPS